MMIELMRNAAWQQLMASLSMLEKAIAICPAAMWNANEVFWYKVYHALFWTDYYLSPNPDHFSPPQPFTLSEFAAEQKIPSVAYSKEELLNYLVYCKQKASNTILQWDAATIEARWVNAYKNFSMLEIAIYNIRHLQHHVAQLNLLLRQRSNTAAQWIDSFIAQ